MARQGLAGTILFGACATLLTAPAFASSGPQDRVSATEKGSLLIFSKVEIRWAQGDGDNYSVVQDTFIDISNDYPQDVSVQMYFVNGDAPLYATSYERYHPGWNWVDNEIMLTKNEPTYWSALTGEPKGVSPFTVLDPTGQGGPGRPDPAGGSDRVLRGYVIAWATDMITNEEISWNHLKGDVTIVNYMNSTAWEYNAWAFQSVTVETPGTKLGTPGRLEMDGDEYARAFDQLLLDFYAVGSPAFSGGYPFNFITVDTDLTLHAVSADLRQETDGPVTTKAHFDVWNMNEVKLSGAHRCITCWDQTLLSYYNIPNHFLLGNLQTDKGKARINGLQSQLCPGSEDAAILGVAAKHLDFNFGYSFAQAGTNLIGMGTQNAEIKYDTLAPPPPATTPEAGTNTVSSSNQLGSRSTNNRR